MLENTWNNFLGQFIFQYKLGIHRDRIHGFHLGKKLKKKKKKVAMSCYCTHTLQYLNFIYIYII